MHRRDLLWPPIPSHSQWMLIDPLQALTGLEGGPFLAGHADILKVNVAVGEEEAQGLGQCLHVEVDHFVVGHVDTVCLEEGGGANFISVFISRDTCFAIRRTNDEIWGEYLAVA